MKRSLVLGGSGALGLAVAKSLRTAGHGAHCDHIERRGDRPVLHVAVGSQALFFDPGAHLTQREVAGLQLSALESGCGYQKPNPDRLVSVDLAIADDQLGGARDDRLQVAR